MILFGHPTGGPFSHNAALAHFESKRLDAFCVPWMPTPGELGLLRRIPGMGDSVNRLERRYFAPLAAAPRIEGRVGEWSRMVRRLAFGERFASEGLSYEANDWLMRTMRRESRRAAVTAVHAYEDCSLWSFEEAKRLGKACIYDLPIGYYRAWEKTQTELVRRYADWLPTGSLPSSGHVRPEQKSREMELADLVIVPSAFVADTVRNYFPGKSIALAPYGVDTAEWSPSMVQRPTEMLTFLFAGQCSLRKGTPMLLEAWRAAGLKDARLQLVGSWQLAEAKQKVLPPHATWIGPVSQDQLRGHYQRAHVFVLPTYFEGRALVIGEALASGLPVLSTRASGAEDLIDASCGKLVPTGNLDALVEGLRWFGRHRERLSELSRAARVQAERYTWGNYRRCVTAAVTPFV